MTLKDQYNQLILEQNSLFFRIESVKREMEFCCDKVIVAVSNLFDITPKSIKNIQTKNGHEGNGQAGKVARDARKICAVVLDAMEIPHGVIGVYFGKDRTTIQKWLKSAMDLSETEPEFKQTLERAKGMI